MKRLLIGLLALVALSACGGEVVTESLPSHASTQTVQQHTALTPAPEPTTPERLRLDGITAPVGPAHAGRRRAGPARRSHRARLVGRTAGVATGVTLLTGHTVHDGGGDLDNLEDVAVGSTAASPASATTVASVRVISKATLAEQAARLFAQTGPHRLVIVTCEGYDPATGHYDSNVVLTATRAN